MQPDSKAKKTPLRCRLFGHSICPDAVRYYWDFRCRHCDWENIECPDPGWLERRWMWVKDQAKAIRKQFKF